MRRIDRGLHAPGQAATAAQSRDLGANTLRFVIPWVPDRTPAFAGDAFGTRESPCTFLLNQGSIENHASGDSIFKDPAEDRNTRDLGVDQTQNQESRDFSRISVVNSSRSRVYISLEQRVALLANISRIPVGKATVFSSTKFVSILSNLIIRSDELLIPSAITFAALCVILAISPLYHCPSSYPQSALSATALETKTALSETIVAQLLLAILAVSASSSDLTVIDKVSRYVEFP